MSRPPLFPQRAGLLALTLLFLGTVVAGLVFPDTWWGTHFLAFLPRTWQLGLLVPATLLIVATVLPTRFFRWVSRADSAHLPPRPWLPALVVSLLVGFSFYQMPIATDFYGDAPRFRDGFERASDELKAGRMDMVLSPNVLVPKIGERTVLNAVQRLASAPDWAHVQESFRRVGAVCAALFAFLWVWFLGLTIPGRLSRWSLAVAGLSGAALQVFAGHQEVYAPSLPATLAVLIVIDRHLRTGKDRFLYATLPLLFVALKCHAAAWMLVPAVGLLFAYRFWPWVRARIGWKLVGVGVLLPIVVTAAVVYFGVLGDHVDPRFLDGSQAPTERMFLPFFSPPPPLDRYTLLSGAHFFDLSQTALLWSVPLLLVLGVLLVLGRGAGRWSSPSVILSALTLILYTALFTFVNPLLSMQMDWDLFSLPLPALLVFTAALAAGTRLSVEPARLLAAVLGLALLGLPAAALVDHSPEALSQRLEALGKSSFRGYWIRSAGTIDQALEVIPDRPERALERRLAVIEELRPYAVEGVDLEYGHMLWRLATYYRKVARDPARALSFHLEAARYAPAYGANLLGLMEAHFLLGEFEEAHDVALRLVAAGHPDPPRALRIALHCAIEAGRHEACIDHCRAYLALRPDDRFIRHVLTQLEQGVPTQQLRRLFAPAR